MRRRRTGHSTWARPTGFAVDSPLEEPGFEPLVPLSGVVVSGWNRNAGIREEDDLEGVVCRGDRAFESHVLQQSDCTTLRYRLAPRTVLSLIDAAGPGRDWQPEARRGWPRDSVAALSVVGSSRG